MQQILYIVGGSIFKDFELGYLGFILLEYLVGVKRLTVYLPYKGNSYL